MTTRTMMKMSKTTIIPPKMKMAVLLSSVLMGISGNGLVVGVVGPVEGCCATITPVLRYRKCRSHFIAIASM